MENEKKIDSQVFHFLTCFFVHCRFVAVNKVSTKLRTVYIVHFKMRSVFCFVLFVCLFVFDSCFCLFVFVLVRFDLPDSDVRTRPHNILVTLGIERWRVRILDPVQTIYLLIIVSGR